MAKCIRVLVVDDSALMRVFISDILNEADEIEVVGTGKDGQDALLKLKSLSPDVVTLDVTMPGMNGLETLSEIMKAQPTPVVMLSSLTQEGADVTLECLHKGAIDFVGKPAGRFGPDISAISEQLVAKVKLASKSKLVSHKLSVLSTTTRPPRSEFRDNDGLIFIGCSTGGPRALQTLIPSLPADLGLPMLIVQHMPPNFTASLAARLDGASSYRVREAQDGDLLEPGVALMAPGGMHLELDERGRVKSHFGPQLHGVRPSIDVTIPSLIRRFGSGIVGVILTGMGRDGATGMKSIHDAGGRTIAQNEATCVVFGMPKVAIDLGAIDRIEPLELIADAVVEEVSHLASPKRRAHLAVGSGF